MTERTYHNADGERCSLDDLCRYEPAWAANRIRYLEAEVERLKVRDETTCYHDWIVTAMLETGHPTQRRCRRCGATRND